MKQPQYKVTHNTGADLRDVEENIFTQDQLLRFLEFKTQRDERNPELRNPAWGTQWVKIEFLF
jgi:hypothetical protein